MAKRTKWLTGAAAWVIFWGFFFFVGRHAFQDADQGFWRAKVEGNEAVAFMYNDAQVQARELAHFTLAMGLAVPLGLFGGAVLWRWFRAVTR